MPVSQGPLGAPHASRSSSHVAWTPAPWETMEVPAPVPEDPLRVTAGSSTGHLVVGRASLRGARGPQARSRASLLQHDEPIAEASPRPRVTLRCGPLAGPG